MNKTKQPPESHLPLMGEESKSLSQCLTRDQRVKQDKPSDSAAVILALRQYPQGGGLTWMRHTRHCGLDPQSRGAVGDAAENKTKQPTNSPSPLMGEGWGEGENDAPHRHVIADLIRNPEAKGGETTSQTNHTGPSFPRRRESTGRGAAGPVIADLIRPFTGRER